MLVSLALAGVVCVAASQQGATCPAVDSIPRTAPRLTVEVNPGMELLAIMAWLAQRYPTPPDRAFLADCRTTMLGLNDGLYSPANRCARNAKRLLATAGSAEGLAFV